MRTFPRVCSAWSTGGTRKHVELGLSALRGSSTALGSLQSAVLWVHRALRALPSLVQPWGTERAVATADQTQV